MKSNVSELRYYEPDNGWGKVISLVEIPSNLWFVVGYEYGSIRIWILGLLFHQAFGFAELVTSREFVR